VHISWPCVFETFEHTHHSPPQKKVKNSYLCFGHIKTLIPAEAGYEFIVEMLTPPFAKHTVAFMTNSVPCIIAPPLSKNYMSSAKLQVRHILFKKIVF